MRTRAVHCVGPRHTDGMLEMSSAAAGGSGGAGAASESFDSRASVGFGRYCLKMIQPRRAAAAGLVGKCGIRCTERRTAVRASNGAVCEAQRFRQRTTRRARAAGLVICEQELLLPDAVVGAAGLG